MTTEPTNPHGDRADRIIRARDAQIRRLTRLVNTLCLLLGLTAASLRFAGNSLNGSAADVALGLAAAATGVAAVWQIAAGPR